MMVEYARCSRYCQEIVVKMWSTQYSLLFYDDWVEIEFPRMTGELVWKGLALRLNLGYGRLEDSVLSESLTPFVCLCRNNSPRIGSM